MLYFIVLVCEMSMMSLLDDFVVQKAFIFWLFLVL
jgi:hypothetical protein